MFDFQDSVFGSAIKIPETAKIVFVSDLFVEDYVGGAELTSQALIDSSPFEIYRLKAKDVTLQLLHQANDKFWIFGNFTQMNPNLIPTIVANLRYSILEYDYKYCKARSPEKHFDIAKTPCDCHNEMTGKIISAFFFGSMGIWWMSEKQMERYHMLFPFLVEKDNIILSSIFDDKTLTSMKCLREAQDQSQRKGWIVLGSNSWVKGFEAAKMWCESNKKEYEVVWNLPYEEVLAKLATAEGFVYLPAGADTCPRMVIEAKLLGCKLHLNDNVQHKDEEWFATDDLTLTESYLYAARSLFWNGIKKMMEYQPKISGYTTTFNCVKQGYPFAECIKSMLTFCDEVCVVDGGSTDGTQEQLRELQREFDEPHAILSNDAFGFSKTSRLKVNVVERDWNHPRFAVFDGMQKAEARKMCVGEFCWQMDSDEVVHEDDTRKITEMARAMPKDVKILSLPVIEFWGGDDKVRVDIQPWKWRLSRNEPDITHGIPSELRRFDADGNMYAAEGTDGCDMITISTGQRVDNMTFYNDQVENIRRMAVLGNPQALSEYEQWFNQATTGLPSVFHYSWHNMARKIRLYRDYWTRHWNSLYNKSIEDTAETNMMFDVPWSKVTDEMIDARANELSTKTGGHIWHTKWRGHCTPHMKCPRPQPSIMKESK